MFRFKTIVFLFVVAVVVITACQPVATPFAEEEFVLTEPPVEEVPAATEPAVPIDTDTPRPLPSDTPESISVPPTEAPPSEVGPCLAATSSADVIDAASVNLDEEIFQSSTPVLIHFWTEWHLPSRAIVPDVEEIANEYAGRVKVVKVNDDEYPEIGYYFGLEQLPTFILVNGGSEQARIAGETSKEEICQMLNQQLP
jgi:thioredoxin 1